MSLFHPDESPEELHERVNVILEKNTRTYPECIVCLTDIKDSAELLKTIHGPYHVYCVDGRP